MEHLWGGVLGQDFFCNAIMHLCADRTYMRHTLQSYLERLPLIKPASLSNNDFADSVYEASIRGTAGDTL